MTVATTPNSGIVTPAPKGLYLAARYPTYADWLPVGYLTRPNRWPPEKRQTVGPDGDHYLFSFLQGAKDRNFPFFLNREETRWGATYGAGELPPPFSTRVRSTSRPDYRDYIASLGLSEEEAQDHLTLLARSGGRKHTDWYETFAAPEPDADGRYSVPFFLRGLRHLEAEAKATAVDAVRQLHPGDRLFPMSDSQNPAHKKAVALRTEGKTMIGYMPRYLANDFRPFLNGNSDLTVEVERVNQDATLALMLLCRMTCTPPRNFRPCAGPEFEILSPELRALMTPD